MIRIALSKGRILKQTMPLLEQIGIVAAEDPFESRKLILSTNKKQNSRHNSTPRVSTS